MVASNKKGMVELVRLPIFRPVLLKHETFWKIESLKKLKDLYG